MFAVYQRGVHEAAEQTGEESELPESLAAAVAFIVFLSRGAQGFSHADVMQGNKGTSEMDALHRTVTVAKDALASMLRKLLNGGHFKGPERHGRPRKTR